MMSSYKPKRSKKVPKKLANNAMQDIRPKANGQETKGENE